MKDQLAENVANAKRIRDSIPKRIKHQDKRDFLELIIKNHVLELQNIELEINLQIQEKTINDMKSIIETQKQIIREKKAESRAREGQANNSNLSLGEIDSNNVTDEDLLEDDQDEQEDDEDELELNDDPIIEEKEGKGDEKGMPVRRSELMKHLSKASKNMNIEENLEDINNELSKLKDAIAIIETQEEKKRNKDPPKRVTKPSETKGKETKLGPTASKKDINLQPQPSAPQFLITNSYPNSSNQVSAQNVNKDNLQNDKKQSISTIYGVKDGKTKKK
eukprot:TRINITY_DN19843_c0_g1_i1.p1 TRINITY_DN19843_c0_g1~~TRINITY_DN19843_c0_g1_i1.p1  ORF type:complete len:278 (-),score=81.99 TRINITY_DN19843_c0_g1_i1:74-907(-)